MKYTLKNVKSEVNAEGNDIRVYTLLDESKKEVSVEGGLWSEGRYYDNSERIEDNIAFGKYVSTLDIGNVEQDFYNVIFYYLTEEQNPETATDDE